MKSLKTKWIILSSVFLLSSFEVAAIAVTVEKNPAEAKYQALLNTGNYDDLTNFLELMVDRMKTQVAAAKKAEVDLSEDEYADEGVIESTHADAVKKQYALKFWSDRLLAAGALQASTEEDKKKIEQITTVLPMIVELVKAAIENSHEANAAYAALANYIKQHAEFLQSLDGIRELIPVITFEKTAKEVVKEGRTNKFKTSVEAYLLELEQKAKDNEASGKQKAAAIERSSNTKVAKGPGGSKGAARRKAAAAKAMADSYSDSDGGLSDADVSEPEGDTSDSGADSVEISSPSKSAKGPGRSKAAAKSNG